MRRPATADDASPTVIGRILGVPDDGEEAQNGSSSGGVDLNSATFEDLREIGLSVTQATRILNHRDREGRFETLEQLGQVPGMTPELVGEIQPKLTIS